VKKFSSNIINPSIKLNQEQLKDTNGSNKMILLLDIGFTRSFRHFRSQKTIAERCHVKQKIDWTTFVN
jgi:hypothetical protein